jgi:hypothetical protein
VGGVQLGDPLRGLEHHRVPLDEAALMPQPAALVPLTGQFLRRPGRDPELLVDLVHERLLASDLPLDHWLTQQMCPLSTMSGPAGADKLTTLSRVTVPGPGR